MTGADLTVGKACPNPRAQSEQAKRIRDRDPASADAAGNFFLGESKVIDEPAEGFGFVQRAEISALNVLYERQL
jgi:hypothetical protein